MMSPAGRRKVRKRKAQIKNSRMKLSVITGIMVLAVFLGYITARFVIGPVIGYNADESEIKLAEDRDESEGGEESEAAGAVPSEGFALQFGAFSTKDAAEELSEKLEAKGISTIIVEQDDKFKVISPIAGDKKEALTALETAKSKEITDVFIASY